LRALITGITGFVGSHLAEYLLSHTDWQVTGAVYGPDENIREISSSLDLLPADLSRLSTTQSMLDQARPNVIFHLAAMAVTGRSWGDPASTVCTNAGMQANILHGVAKLELDTRIIVVGSSEEYGAVSEELLPVTEEAPFRPMNPYAVSKVAQDMLGLQYHLSHGLDTIRVRPFNHIGPRQSLGFVTPDFASQVARIEAGLQDPVLRVGNLSAERDFTDVRDVVRAYYLLALKGRSGEAYNVGSGQSHAAREVLDYYVSHSTARIAIEQDPDRLRPSDVPRIVCNCEKLRACTGWEPAISFEQSLADVLHDWRTRLAEGRQGA
jgi:GDP-4-dehydro-6-deoxy-D-mannose reductase